MTSDPGAASIAASRWSGFGPGSSPSPVARTTSKTVALGDVHVDVVRARLSTMSADVSRVRSLAMTTQVPHPERVTHHALLLVPQQWGGAYSM